MIKLIAAVDEKNGIANNSGIPWNLKADKEYFRDKISTGNILMGRGVYEELKGPLGSGLNYVLTHRHALREGFIAISDIDDIIQHSDDLWIIGGAEVYGQTINLADEIYITKIHKDFHCTKFFPEINDDFKIVSDSGKLEDNKLVFNFLKYKKVK
jgi:dihydrofolate reductase